MRVPYRKPGKFSQVVQDPIMTGNKFVELKNKLEKLKKIRPKAAGEVSRLAELGDFSENVEYQLDKGRLRGINQSILDLEKQINRADIILPNKNLGIVSVGSKVIVESDGKQKTFQILGSSEANPQKEIISYNSPIGAALIGRKEGDLVKVKIRDKETEYKIIKIE